jgi:hypothetical protein
MIISFSAKNFAGYSTAPAIRFSLDNNIVVNEISAVRVGRL